MRLKLFGHPIVNHEPLLLQRPLSANWKSAHIASIPKKNQNPISPESYRPMLILAFSAKMFEWIESYVYFANRHNNTVEPVFLILKLDILLGLNRKTPSIRQCLLDLKKAFDSVWQYGHAFKLSIILNFFRHLSKLILSFQDERNPKSTYSNTSRHLTHVLPVSHKD